MMADPEARIPVARYASLYRLLTERINDEGFALFSRPVRRGSFEFLCRAVLSSADLDEALQRAGRYLGLVLDDLAIEIRRSETSAQLHIRPTATFQASGAGRVFAFEWLLRLINGLGAWLIARPLAFDAVEFPYPQPPHAFDYGLVFAPQYTFDTPGLVAHFPLDYLFAPVRRDETALRLFLSEAPASITTLYRRDRAVSLRARDAIRAALPEQRTLPEVARMLFLSPRTLHRRLEEEGTTFRTIRDGLRRDLAMEWLTKSQRPLGRIAADLGFADASAFYRAFTGWTGEGPRQFRLRTRS
ncbi:MAG: AraC family transcriptional regulator [Rhodocyclaceae bacterium]|jgi:AraC-like DNA-binding protein|nr:AraC family transcriptional regulator [Rhodocyclaceae bacterium]